MVEQRWRIEVDRKRCLGSGACVAIAAQHFAMVDDRSSPRSELVTPDDIVLGAAESCVMGAILVSTADTGAILAPEQ
ncbi:4Fe-4S domain-containing protein [Nocardia vulneris]|uniref:4Fe-4S domain-containing protein n=1 Tax=Nocardia vulneris TaxID=1141657 RepID=UPI0009E22649